MLLGLITLILQMEKQRLAQMKGAAEALRGVTKPGRGPKSVCGRQHAAIQPSSSLGTRCEASFLSFTKIVTPFVFYKPQMCPLTIQLRLAL